MKSFTDIEQSKKLAEILPIESADMYYHNRVDIPDNFPLPIEWKHSNKLLSQEIPCWSLAALLEQLDDEITDEDGNDYHLTIVKKSLQYQLYYHDLWGQVEDIETDYYDDLIDACYEMILKLHEQNLI